MGEKKFSGVNGSVESPALSADYKKARRFDKLRVGKLGVYFRDGLKLRFIRYDFIDRAFIRIHEVNGKMCCGNTVFQYFRLVLVHGGREYADVISEDENAMDEALALIHENAPSVAIGFENREK